MNFTEQPYGYNKKEVDAYIERLKASYESKLMDEKLKTLESERRLLTFKNQHSDIAHKEKSIMEALDVLEKAKKFQEEGTRNFYSLVFDKLKLLINELDMRFPNMRRNSEYNNILGELYNLVNDYKEKFVPESSMASTLNSSNDTMRILLNKMQERNLPKKEAKEVKITPSSADTTKYTNFYKRNSFVFKPKDRVEDMTGEANDARELNNTLHKPTEARELNAHNLKNGTREENPFENNSYYNGKRITPDEGVSKYPKSESGFSFEEALHPKVGLEEIMKAFDFYNDSKKSGQN